ncbi:MAG: prepilin-type N-terminal cleavage/methylation domain-containing protein [Oscillospiraceae bacterium]
MKKRATRGFTVVEMLMAMLILAIVGVGLTTGISSAIGVYHTSVFTSESQLLTGTLDTALADVLRYAKYEKAATEEEGDTTAHFSNTNYRVVNGSLLADEGRLKMNPTDGEPTKDTLLNLLSDSAYSTMSLRDLTLKYEDTTHVFSGSYTLVSTRDSTLTKTVNFAYRTLVC